VRGFLENPQWPTGTDLSTPNNLPAKIENIVNDLPEPPSIEEAQAMAEAAAVDPNDYVSVDSYAKGLSTKASKAIAVIGHFSIVACPAPSQTIDAIEDIMDHRKTIDPNEIDMMVSQPKTFLGVPTWRMRPLSFQETPIYEMVQMAQNLPDCAIADSEMHANHIKVLQAGLDIVHGYDDALRLYIHALEKRKAEIDADKPDVDIEDVSTRAIADVILKDDISNRLGDLKASRAFVRAHAGNFATTMLVVKKSKREKEHMAELAANILLPLQQVQRAFLAYQSSKFGEAAGVVNGILELSDGPIVEKAHDAKTIMEQSLGTLELMIERMQNDLRASNATIIDITQKTDEAAAKGEAKEIKMPQP
jgi:hypothetical protein